MFLWVGIINNNFLYNYNYPTTGLQTQSILYQLLLNLPKPVRAFLAPLFLHPKEAQDYISRAWSKQSTSRLSISESLPLSSLKYQIRSMLLIHLQFQTFFPECQWVSLTFWNKQLVTNCLCPFKWQSIRRINTIVGLQFGWSSSFK